MELGPKTWAQVAAQPPKDCTRPKPAAPEKRPAAQSLPSMTYRAPRQAPLLAAASTAAQSPGTCTHSQPRDMPSMEDCLPGEILEAILGFLDRETLCTARLVSKTFCAAASTHICSLTFRKTHQAVTCPRFPRLSRVTVTHCAKEAKSEEVDPSLRDLLTTLEIQGTPFEDCQVFGRETLSQIGLMPKLRELDVSLPGLKGELDVGAMAGVLCHLKILRISVPKCNFSSAITIASLTSLKELRIIPFAQLDIGSLGTSWLEQATALRNLRALSLDTPSEALPLIGNLTGLTALSWVHYDEESSSYSLAPLTRLTGLKSVGLRDVRLHLNGMSESNVAIACSLGFGSLANLELEASDRCGKFLTRQTALTRLSLGGGLCNLQHIGALRLELLQSLELRRLASVDAEGLASLRKATSLTDLSIITGFDHRPPPDLRLSHALAGLTQLRSLVLVSRCGGLEFLDYASALKPLTGLTRLGISCYDLGEWDFRALLNLTGLRVLHLAHTPSIGHLVAELSVLTNLTTLRMNSCGVGSLAPFTSVVNPLRHARGWPPVDASFITPTVHAAT